MRFQLRPKRVFILAAGFLAFSAALAGVTIYKLSSSEKWVRHTYQILLELGQLQSNLSKLGRDRTAFLDSADGRYVTDFSETRRQIAIELQNVTALTVDNPEQQANCSLLYDSVNGRLKMLADSIQVGGSASSEAQRQYTDEAVNSGFETGAITDRMTQIEQNLLEKRQTITSTLFLTILSILVSTFCLSVFTFWLYYRLLSKELDERKAAERSAQSLSIALMRVQDDERRKFSRELHDSLGQILVCAKMLADQVSNEVPGDARLIELIATLQDALKETRTLSQLLHPPLLDEMGFAAAAKWFIDNFSQRTGIAVVFDCPSELPKLPNRLEFVMFRVLQECLTNVHRHSRSTTAQVSVSVKDQIAGLEVRDNGVGIPREKLEAFLFTGTGVGVGLAGIKQRVKEQGGTLSVRSDSGGTVVSVSFTSSTPFTAASSVAAN
jgi:signal transduction histidine kinase